MNAEKLKCERVFDLKTEAEIMKALEICGTDDDCSECPFYTEIGCDTNIHLNALDLINRKNAEIERLKKANESFSCLGQLYSEIKTEAIKEFAERLKEEVSHIPAWGSVAEKKIDNLVKEMTSQL